MDNFVHGQGKADKLALSNTSLVRPGLLLYRITGEEAYLKKCEAMYDFIRKNNIFDASTGQVNEGVKWIIGKPDSGTVEKSGNVYNSGNFLEAANLLNRVTGDESYYRDAELAIHYVMKKPILGDGGRYQTQWAYRFLKGLSEFATDHRLWPQYRSWMMQNAEAAWNNRDEHNLTWNDWRKPTDDPKINALETSSAVAIWQLLPPLDRPELAGDFEIHRSDGNLAMSVVSRKAGVPLLLQWPADASFAVWTLKPTSGGLFQIQNVKSDLVASVDAASFQPGAKVVQQQPQAALAGDDQWWVVENADGSYSFYNHGSNQALTAAGPSEPGAHLTQSYADDGPSPAVHARRQALGRSAGSQSEVIFPSRKRQRRIERTVVRR